jgi:hypothetical protein
MGAGCEIEERVWYGGRKKNGRGGFPFFVFTLYPNYLLRISMFSAIVENHATKLTR